jgi:hypothetical protein
MRSSFCLAFSLAALLIGATPMQQQISEYLSMLPQGSATVTLNELSTGHFNPT